jgi:hypothetical protein
MAHDQIAEKTAGPPAQVDGQLGLGETRAQELARIEEADLKRRYADAELTVAQKAKRADEELLLIARRRLDAWREWGLALGRPMSPEEAGAVRGSDSSTSERDAQYRARRIAAIPEDKFEEFKTGAGPDKLTLAGALRLLPRAGGERKPTKSLMHQFRSACWVAVRLRRAQNRDDKQIGRELHAAVDWALRQSEQPEEE